MFLTAVVARQTQMHEPGVRRAEFDAPFSGTDQVAVDGGLDRRVFRAGPAVLQKVGTDGVECRVVSAAGRGIGVAVRELRCGAMVRRAAGDREPRRSQRDSFAARAPVERIPAGVVGPTIDRNGVDRIIKRELKRIQSADDRLQVAPELNAAVQQDQQIQVAVGARISANSRAVRDDAAEARSQRADKPGLDLTGEVGPIDESRLRG